jgi:hypothetical protein
MMMPGDVGGDAARQNSPKFSGLIALEANAEDRIVAASANAIRSNPHHCIMTRSIFRDRRWSISRFFESRNAPGLCVDAFS